MARYIDAEKLYRKVKEETNPYGKPTLDYESGVKVLNMIKQESTADVVEVVRCKDCGASRNLYGDVIYCSCFGHVITKDDFCSKGYLVLNQKGSE